MVIEHRFKDVPVKQPKKKAEVKKKERAMVERIKEPEMARSGKLSNYGSIWAVADRSYYNPL